MFLAQQRLWDLAWVGGWGHYMSCSEGQGTVKRRDRHHIVLEAAGKVGEGGAHGYLCWFLSPPRPRQAGGDVSPCTHRIEVDGGPPQTQSLSRNRKVMPSFWGFGNNRQQQEVPPRLEQHWGSGHRCGFKCLCPIASRNQDRKRYVGRLYAAYSGHLCLAGRPLEPH